MKETSDTLVQHPGMRRFLVKMRVPIGIVVIVLLAPFVQRQWLLAGFVVSMLGELIQIWCFASLDKNATLTVRGPYTMVRNPMYLGRYFIVLGFLMLAGQWWLLLAFTVGYWLYMDSRVQREEAHLRPIFGAPYDDYCATGAPLRARLAAGRQDRRLLERGAVQAEQRRHQPARHAGGVGAGGGVDAVGRAAAEGLNGPAAAGGPVRTECRRPCRRSRCSTWLPASTPAHCRRPAPGGPQAARGCCSRLRHRRRRRPCLRGCRASSFRWR